MPIRFGTYNIRNGRNGGLEPALRGMYQANMDLGIFQETKCTDEIYTRESAGYRVVATDAPSRHRGRVALLYRLSPLFAVEAVREYGPNVMSFEVATGARRWYIIGCYLAPDDNLTIERVVAALRDRPKGTVLVVAGGLNTVISYFVRSQRGDETLYRLSVVGGKVSSDDIPPPRSRCNLEA